MIPVFIGYDRREPVAFHVCANSIIRNSSTPVSIIPLALNLLDDYRESHTDASNTFVYSRFLVPHLMGFQGWAIYIDGDMVVKSDIRELWQLRDAAYDVQVVKHDYRTRAQTKYLGSKNEDYPRKNWSSVILWNCGSPQHRHLTPSFVESSTGQYLHRFAWVPDSNIGSLPPTWNWLVDEHGFNAQARLMHWTLGTPCFEEYQSAPGADYWHQEFQDAVGHEKKT